MSFFLPRVFRGGNKGGDREGGRRYNLPLPNFIVAVSLVLTAEESDLAGFDKGTDGLDMV
jgi:hypothetical protein